MENFFYDDKFCSSIEDLMELFDLDEDNLNDLEDQWAITCQESSLEPIFELGEEFVVQAVVDSSDIWEERFPEDADDTFDAIKKAIRESFDIQKLNDNLPKLYYPNGKKFQLTKQDLVVYCNSNPSQQ